MLSNLNAAKPTEDTRSSFGSVPLQIASEDGETYSVNLTKTDLDYVEQFYNNLTQVGESLSPVGKIESKGDFVGRFFHTNAVFLSVKSGEDEVGVAYVTNIIPSYSADFNFLFWDRRTKGRQKLVLSIMEWFAEEFMIRRFELRCHALAFYALHRIYKIGAFYEGTKRKAWRYEDKIIDLHIFSILATEIDEDSTFIPRTPSQRKWYSRLTKGGNNA
jgi:hypothetical protein